MLSCHLEGEIHIALSGHDSLDIVMPFNKPIAMTLASSSDSTDEKADLSLYPLTKSNIKCVAFTKT